MYFNVSAPVFGLILFLEHLCYGQSMLGLRKGDICRGRGENAHRCVLLKDCPQIGDFRRKRPTICSFQGIDPIICCPPNPINRKLNTTLVSNGNAQRNCNRLNSRPKRCDNKRTRRQEITFRPLVVGGKSSKPRVHTYMVLIGFGEENDKVWSCGGSLISEKWVLSAAHCSSPKGLGPARWARVGELDTSSTNEDAKPQDKKIIERIVHPNYKEPAVYHDIVLFRLDSDVVTNNWVDTICLHTEAQINVNKATVVGWGRLDFVGPTSPQLQEVDLTLVNGNECRRLHSKGADAVIPQGVNPDIMICAGEKEGGKDACSGDSGGPFVINSPDSCLKTQIGITSFGKDCGLPNTPGVYTRVSYYVPWIESIVWPN